MTSRIPLLLATVAAAAAGLVLALPGAAFAQIVELGQTQTPLVAPSCVAGQPLSSCTIVLTRTTAVSAMSDGLINPMRVNRQGFIVSFTVGLSKLVSSAKQRAAIIKSQNAEYGGPPELAVTVLKPGPDNTFTVAGESALYPLTPFLGQVLQEPLSVPPAFSSFTALHVTRGEVIGLTVPTWAPLLSYSLSKSQFAYRQSRRANCGHTAAAQTAQTKVGEAQRYGCYYTGTRMEYSVTEVVDTPAPKTYVGDVLASRR